MEAEIAQLESWYQKQLENIRQHADNMYAKMSARQKSHHQVRIGNWVRTQSQHLANIRDQCLRSIKSKWMKSNKKAVLVGINYVGSQNELKGCVNDVYKIRDLLVSRYDYLHENIKLLLDGEATRANILSEFTNLVENAQEGDRICFTFSGHGYYQSDLYKPD